VGTVTANLAPLLIVGCCHLIVAHASAIAQKFHAGRRNRFLNVALVTGKRRNFETNAGYRKQHLAGEIMTQ